MVGGALGAALRRAGEEAPVIWRSLAHATSLSAPEHHARGGFCSGGDSSSDPSTSGRAPLPSPARCSAARFRATAHSPLLSPPAPCLGLLRSFSLDVCSRQGGTISITTMQGTLHANHPPSSHGFASAAAPQSRRRRLQLDEIPAFRAPDWQPRGPEKPASPSTAISDKGSGKGSRTPTHSGETMDWREMLRLARQQQQYEQQEVGERGRVPFATLARDCGPSCALGNTLFSSPSPPTPHAGRAPASEPAGCLVAAAAGGARHADGQLPAAAHLSQV